MKISYDAKRAFHNGSGLGNYSRDLIRMMSKEMPNSMLFLLNPKSSNRFTFTAPNIKQIQPNKSFTSTLWRLFKAYSVSKENNVDIFHGLSNELPYGNSFGIKKVVTIHDVIFLRFPQWYKAIDRSIYKRKTLNACNNADVIVAISEQTKRDLIEYLNVPESKIKVIYQTCHSAFLQKYDNAELNRIKIKYNLPNSFILNVGTIEKRKNSRFILEAMKHTPDLPMVIIGRKTDYYSELNDYARVHNLTDRLINPVVDSMEDLAKIYQLATVFIYPSIFEGFGIPVIEALFSNTPVITNYSGVFPEAGGPHSYYCKIDDVKSLVEQIKYVLENPEDVEKACKESRIFANKFTQEVLAKQWNTLYNQLLNS